MLRSLSSSISGLRSHQIRMDIIGNNIANVNTVGYKGSRVTFEESLNQLLAGAGRAQGDQGGTNPIQVGLGMSVGSIDGRMQQGNLQSTGQVTDLAIEGRAFFAVSNGEGMYYSRNGAFQIDSAGYLVLPNNGFVLQGQMADNKGNFPVGTVNDNIQIPFNEQSPANATSRVQFSRNLDSNSGAKGSVLHTQRFLHHAEGNDLATSLFDSKGQPLGMEAGDTLTFSALNPSTGQTVSSQFTVDANTTLQNIAQAIEVFLKDPSGPNAGIQTKVDLVTIADDVNSVPQSNNRGALTFYGNNDNAIQNFQITSDQPISSSSITKAFSVPTAIAQNTTKYSIITDRLRGPAAADNRLSEIYDAGGNSLGLEDNDEISINGDIGGVGTSNVSPMTFISGTPDNPSGTPPTGKSGTTLNDLLINIKDNFSLPERDGTPDNNSSVSINGSGSKDNVPDGSIVIRGMPEKSFEITNVSIKSTNDNNSKPAPLFFNSNMTFTSIQQARDTGVYDTSITVYDDTGSPHTLTMRYLHTGTPNNWQWEINMGQQEEILQGGRGNLTFAQDGSVSSFTFEDGASQLLFDPKNGAAAVGVDLNVGGPGDFTGLTQFRSPTTAAAVSQDGYELGRLREISIDEFGIINGAFTNGISKALAKITIVDFTNPSGLMKVGDSMFAETANSGEPIHGQPGVESSSTLKPGTLELSNVELAQEFTDMITTQRGYQANARVITVSDSLLEELVALKR